MKNCFIFIVFLALTACSREVPFKEPSIQEPCRATVAKNIESTAVNDVLESVKVIDWGPQSTTVGVNPNAQPGGELGLWIRLSSTEKLGELQLLFDGEPAVVTTVVGDGLVTAAVLASQLDAVGKMDVSLFQVQTKKVIQVGVFSVSSN